MRLYRALLHLYPASFRAEYAEELCAVFASRRREVSGIGVAAFWIATLADTVASAARTHFDILRQDLHYNWRSLRRAPGFAITAIVVASLGIGATTATFSIADHVLVRSLPFPEADRLVSLWQDQSHRGFSRIELSPPNYRDWVQMSTSFESSAAFTEFSSNLVGTGDPLYLDGVQATVTLFDTLRARAAIGRVFTEADGRSGAPATLILSDGLWRAQFGADPGVIGRVVTLDDQRFTVIGVMPRGFYFPSRNEEFWVPTRLDKPWDRDRKNIYLRAVARLKPGLSLEQAQSEMRLIAARLERAYPNENLHTSATVVQLRDDVARQARLLIVALVAASVCVLLIACTNLSSLLLARSLSRRHEVAVRSALGAGRERLARQMLTEGAVLAVVGGALGVLVATSVVPLVARLVPTRLPIAEVPAVDGRLLALAVLLTMATAIGFGVIPALRASREDAIGGLREGPRAGSGRATERLRSALVIAEVVASVVLLVGAGLLIRALWRVQAIDPGFRSEGVLTMRTQLPMPKYAETERRVQFYRRVLSEIQQLPGVSSAAYITFLPMTMRGGIWPVSPDRPAEEPGESRMSSLRFVTPGFFATAGIPFRTGRDVADTDTREAPSVAVVSESFVKQYLNGDRQPIGRRFFMAFAERTIVGVVADVKVRGLERISEPQVYVPVRQVADGGLMGYAPKDLIVKASVAPMTLAPAIREIVAKADPQQPVSDVRLLKEIVDGETTPRKVQVRLLAAFAGVAIVLAGIGIHGVLAFSVSQRVREIAVRMALGASSRDILRMVVGYGLLLAFAGAVLGVACAYPAGMAMRALLAGVSPADLATFGVAVGVTFVMTLAGSLFPALRAIRVDPIAVMRAD